MHNVLCETIGVEFLQKIPKSSGLEICRALKISLLFDDEILCSEGEVPKDMFIIVTGHLGAFIPSNSKSASGLGGRRLTSNYNQ